MAKVTYEGFLSPDNSVSLLAGWNTIGYWFEQAMSPEEAFNAMIVNENLYFVTGYGEQGAVFFDPYGEPFLNTLTAMENGFGYMIKLNEPVEDFQYPEPGGAVAKQLAYHTNPDIIKTNITMFINGTLTLEDIELEEGTRVNIFTESGLLVGEMDIVQVMYAKFMCQ